MRIAVIGAKGLPPRQGGIEHYCAEIYPQVIAQGHTVDLFAQSSYTSFPWFSCYNFQGISVTVLPSLSLNGVDTFLASAMAALLTSTKHYDVIHFHALGPALFTIIPRLTSTAKVVVTCHGLDWQRAKWGKFSSSLIRLGEKAAVRYAHEIVVVSAELQQYFRNTYQRETTFIANAPAEYAHSDARFSFARSLGLEPGKYMLFLGRLVPEKCPDLLIQAFQALSAHHWKLVFVGGNGGTDGFTSKLYRLAATNPNIIFTGELRGARLAEMMRGAGLFILPSNLEGSPLALLEAMRERIPAIASDIEAHQELVQTNKGLLFRQGSVNSLRESLQWALNHPIEMSEMAERASKAILLNHSWPHVSAAMLQVYDALDGCAAAPDLSLRRN